APTTANYDSASSAKFGKPVYSDAWGTLYDQYGNVLVQGTPPPAPAPAPAPATAPAATGFNGYTDASSGGGYGSAMDQIIGEETNYGAPAASPEEQQAAQAAAQAYLAQIAQGVSLGVDVP